MRSEVLSVLYSGMILKVNQRNPTVDEYNELRQLAGWPTFEEAIVRTGLSNSIFSVVIQNESGTIIGMGRIVGDNAIYLHIQDVIVRPGFQRKGNW